MDSEPRSRADRAVGEQGERDAWSGPDFSQLDVTTTIVAELLCESIDLRPSQTVLDVATGSGNGALAAARRGCRVRGVDRIPGLLERARERARAERLQARFQLGDAQALPFPDASFDVVLSVFGVTFAPEGRQAATEMVRVCRPAGTLVLASWTPESAIGAIYRHTVRAGLAHTSSGPPTWGTEQGLRSLFGGHIRALAVSPRTFIFRCRSPERFLELMQMSYSSLLSSLQPTGGLDEDAMHHVLTPIVRRFKRAEDGSIIVPSSYLEVVATKC